jgi:hypothetical protein
MVEGAADFFRNFPDISALAPKVKDSPSRGIINVADLTVGVSAVATAR